MANGMGQFQLRAEKQGLQSLDELDQYCYYVAGVVGQMLTRLFCLHSAAVAKNHDALMALAISFGQGLQMTNILKDVWEDYQLGACWLPRQLFAEEGFDLRDLSTGRNRQGFERGHSPPGWHCPWTFAERRDLFLAHPRSMRPVSVTSVSGQSGWRF